MIVVLVILLTSIGIAAEGTETFTWDRREELIVITVGDGGVEGFNEFVRELEKVLPGVSGWGSGSILDFTTNKKDLKKMRDNHIIFIIRLKNIRELKKLEAEYAELTPITYSELKSYPSLSFYFSRNDEGKIRGVIITEKVTSLLVKQLTETELPLNTFFRYENGQLKKIEKE
jgi:hypothetical protein